jgi:hypothetical protein
VNGNTNTYPGSLTELEASTGAVENVISAPAYGFDGPVAPPVDGPDLVVANSYDASLTEVNASTGALARVVSGPSYRSAGPCAMVLRGSCVWAGPIGDQTKIRAAPRSLSMPVGGHEILNGDGQITARLRPRDPRAGGHQSCLVIDRCPVASTTGRPPRLC